MRTLCIYHSSDLDGWMSSAIVKHWWLTQRPNYLIWDKEVEFGDCITARPKNSTNFEDLHLLGWNYGDKIPDTSNYDKIIMCDISFPIEEMNKLALKFGKDFIWVDHHISIIKEFDVTNNPTLKVKPYVPGLRDIKFAACELTWMYFFPEQNMPELVKLLGRYDCFGHKGTNEEQAVMEFQYGARATIKDNVEAYESLTQVVSKEIQVSKNLYSMLNQAGKILFAQACNEAKVNYTKRFDVQLPKGDVNTYIIYKMYFGTKMYLTNELLGVSEYSSTYKKYFNKTTAEKLKIYWEKHTSEEHVVEKVPNLYNGLFFKFAAVNVSRFNPDAFGIDYRKDGYDGIMSFSYNAKTDSWNTSLYSNKPEVDCSLIAKQFGGGGHKGAAGCSIKDFKPLIIKK